MSFFNFMGQRQPHVMDDSGAGNFGQNLEQQQPGGMQALASNPNFIQLLAGIGAGLDPEGIGGAVGGPTAQMSRHQAMQQAAAKQQKRDTQLMDQLIAAISGRDPSQLVGPVDDPSTFNKMSLDEKGLHIDAPFPGQAATGTGVGTGRQMPNVTDPPMESRRSPQAQGQRGAGFTQPSPTGQRDFSPFSRRLIG